MRYAACWVLAALFSTRVLAEGPAMSDVVQGNNRFALELHSRLAKQPGNLFYSPGSLSMALAMTYAGARGETAAEMARILHFPADSEKLHESFGALRKELNGAGDGGKVSHRLSVANRLWGQAGFHFLPDFLAITREAYGAELAQVDFVYEAESARRTINTWVEEQTQAKIVDLIPPGEIDDLTRLVLTNAIYFKGDWTKPFARAATRDDTFHVGGEETVTVPLMFRSDSFAFRSGDGMKIVELPYGKGELSAVAILPDAVDGLPALEAKLTADELARWLGGLRRRKVQVFLPRFKVTSQFSLRDVLAAMGMRLAFSKDGADLSGISTEEKLSISAVLHKAFVDVNEEGTEAAAATGVVVGVRAAMLPEEPAVFRADHPFLFLIRDTRSGMILFMGRVINPRA
jgi:serpin B